MVIGYHLDNPVLIGKWAQTL